MVSTNRNMNIVWVVLFMVMYNSGTSSNAISSNVSSRRPDVVNVGALICFNSMIGKVAKVAINAAVDEVNSHPNILNGTKLKVVMHDTKTSDFLGIVEGLCIYILRCMYILMVT